MEVRSCLLRDAAMPSSVRQRRLLRRLVDARNTREASSVPGPRTVGTFVRLHVLEATLRPGDYELQPLRRRRGPRLRRRRGPILDSDFLLITHGRSRVQKPADRIHCSGRGLRAALFLPGLCIHVHEHVA